MLALRHVTLRFADKTILNDFSFAFEPGKVTCLLGPSGCGKTTLLRVASGLLKPDGGMVEQLQPMRASYVFQEDRLLPWFGALENLTAVGIAPRAAERMLRRMGLGGEMHTHPPEMSGGMRRRVAIARALAYNADIFFLDEPLRGLDGGTAAPVLAEIRTALAQKTALLISHDPQEALALGDILVRVGGPPVRIEEVVPAANFDDPEALKRWLRTDIHR